LSNLFQKIKFYLLKEQFRPSLIGLFVNPFYFSRRAIYQNIKRYSGEVSGIILDIGCGSKPYEKLFSSDKYIGIDVVMTGHKHTNSKIDVYYDGTTIPFNDNHFDSVVCFEVLEHVFNPDVFVKEACRVLKPGGNAIFTVPFIWDECEQPYDYARYSSFGLKHLFESGGFKVVKSRKFLTDFRIITLLINAYIFKVIRTVIPNKLSYVFILPFTSIINLLGLIFTLSPKNSDMYFGNIFHLTKDLQS
jgi:SAM-dependent methyltransferase